MRTARSRSVTRSQGARRARRSIAVGLVALVAASCGIGVTLPPLHVTDVSARLQGRVGDRHTGTDEYWFEYGLTADYGSSTPRRQQNVSATDVRYAVEEVLGGLAEGTTYHYRLCAVDADDHGVCGIDQTFTTTSGFDSVSGQGFVFFLGTFLVVGGDITASSDPDGSNPTGEAWLAPSTEDVKLADIGPVTCLRVVSNRAAVGLMAYNGGPGSDPEPRPVVTFVEDNGPTGDRYSTGTIAAPATNCPLPTAASFVPSPNGSGPVLVRGDFVVHDHVDTP